MVVIFIAQFTHFITFILFKYITQSKLSPFNFLVVKYNSIVEKFRGINIEGTLCCETILYNKLTSFCFAPITEHRISTTSSLKNKRENQYFPRFLYLCLWSKIDHMDMWKSAELPYVCCLTDCQDMQLVSH